MAKKTTPLMQQYNGIKAKYPDALLLFRVGDFYETFGQDAVKAAKILNITLTARNNGGDQTELAGFPHHSVNTYLPKLVMAGCRVAICDQLEDPKQTKTIVKRGVTELITPGVALNDDILQSKTNNFLAAVHLTDDLCGISFLDVSTGEFLVAEGPIQTIDTLLENFNPSEVLFNKQKRKRVLEHFGHQWGCFFLEDWVFQSDYTREKLLGHFNTKSLKGFGLQDKTVGAIAAGAALHYLGETQHHRIAHIAKISRIVQDAYVWMDQFTMRNLELHQGQSSDAATLMNVMDHTISPMGGRLLKRWLALPLKTVEAIKGRQDIVRYWLEHDQLRGELRQTLKSVGDLERLVSKSATGKINPREVVLLCQSLRSTQAIQNMSAATQNKALELLANRIDSCEALCLKIEKTLDADAPVHWSKGQVIAPGFNDELDELRSIAYGGKAHLQKMLEGHQEETGISSLKIANNNVFGYYIEVRNAHKDKVPPEWIRKQTLVNAERYITEELKTYEAKIYGAEERISGLEQELFLGLVSDISPYIAAIQQTAQALAQLDCLSGFAELAQRANYVCPVVNDSFDLDIKQGRHPVIETQLAEDTPYIANDVFLDRSNQQMIMITGPNMSGKSALLRQTALIVIMAQMGSYVPAKAVTMGVVDKIFTRVGASDNISMGESTFMVEMNETASILNNVSDRSLILLDEIGRGTSTYDGISIAWSISEYLHEHAAQPKTLFATHYHELNDMSETFDRIKNYNVSVKELKDTVLFMRTLVPGGSEHSFGIHVAKMAGMPQRVVRRAEEILERLEASRGAKERHAAVKAAADSEMQLSFFQLDDPLLEGIKQKIVAMNIDDLTPVAALNALNDIKSMLVKGEDSATEK
ncbi:DNA mismatch repair protein MutS [Flavobacteriaceae bacterium]|nr:DNA mismatch repair protein MutS [Flavobacteriaceae bacterium]